MSNSINIRRSYFGKNKYGEVIDNNFNQLAFSTTGSLSDFVTNFALNFLSFTPEQLSFFYSSSVEIALSASDSDYGNEVQRLEALISGARQELEDRKENTPVEHPIVPNGSFIRTSTPLITKDEIKLSKGTFYYIDDGKKRPIDNAETFVSLFTSKTKTNPRGRRLNAFGDKDFVNLKDNVAVDTIGFLTNKQFPSGTEVRGYNLGSEGAGSQTANSSTETFYNNAYPPVGRTGSLEDPEIIYNNLSYLWNGEEWVLLYPPIGRLGQFTGEVTTYGGQNYVWDGFGEWNQSITPVVDTQTTTQFSPFGVAGENIGDTRKDADNKEYRWDGENWNLVTETKTPVIDLSPFGVAGGYTGEKKTYSNKEYMWNGQNWQIIKYEYTNTIEEA